MRKIFWIVALSCLTLGAVTPRTALADDEEGVKLAKDVFMAVGVKTWINTWQTNLTGTGVNWLQHDNGPVVGWIPNASIKIQNFLMTGSYMTSGKYNFPISTDYTGGNPASLNAPTIVGNRQEGDFNLGVYVCRSLALTMGYKGVTEGFTVTNNLTNIQTGKYTAGVPITSKVIYNGITFGILGSVPFGHGFSGYGSGVGGILFPQYSPNTSTYQDTAEYEATELGLAWKAGRTPLTLSAGYKFQVIQTNINSQNSVTYAPLPRSDVTRGFTLGLNLVF
jgi:hypothetical protein